MWPVQPHPRISLVGPRLRETVRQDRQSSPGGDRQRREHRRRRRAAPERRPTRRPGLNAFVRRRCWTRLGSHQSLSRHRSRARRKAHRVFVLAAVAPTPASRHFRLFRVWRRRAWQSRMDPFRSADQEDEAADMLRRAGRPLRSLRTTTAHWHMHLIAKSRVAARALGEKSPLFPPLSGGADLPALLSHPTLRLRSVPPGWQHAHARHSGPRSARRWLAAWR